MVGSSLEGVLVEWFRVVVGVVGGWWWELLEWWAPHTHTPHTHIHTFKSHCLWLGSDIHMCTALVMKICTNNI